MFGSRTYGHFSGGAYGSCLYAVDAEPALQTGHTDKRRRRKLCTTDQRRVRVWKITRRSSFSTLMSSRTSSQASKVHLQAS